MTGSVIPPTPQMRKQILEEKEMAQSELNSGTLAGFPDSVASRWSDGREKGALGMVLKLWFSHKETMVQKSKGTC